MIKRQKWTQDEDNVLLEIMKSDLFKGKWDVVAAELKKRGYYKTPKQSKTRWINNLSPAVNKNKWSNKDMENLFEAYQYHGNRWRKIAERFDGRTDNCVKNQFFSLIRKALRTAVKLIGKKSDLSCTRIINKIKPKILADFLNQEIVVSNTNSRKNIKMNALDFVKTYVCKRSKDSSNSLDAADKDVIHTCIDLLLSMNANYLNEKKGKKPEIKDLKIKNETHEKTSYKMEMEPHNTLVFKEDLINRSMSRSISRESPQSKTEDSSQHLTMIKNSLTQINDLLNMTGHFNNYSYGSAENLKTSLITMFDKLGVLARDVKDKLSKLNCDEQNLYDIANYLTTHSLPVSQGATSDIKQEKFQSPQRSKDNFISDKVSHRPFSTKNVDVSVSKDFEGVLHSCKSGKESFNNFAGIKMPPEACNESWAGWLKQSEYGSLVEGFRLNPSIINPVNDLVKDKDTKPNVGQILMVNKSVTESNFEGLSSGEGYCFEFAKKPDTMSNFNKSSTDNTNNRTSALLINIFGKNDNL